MIKIKKYQIEDYISDATQDALDLKADLVDGKVPASQLPSFVDDVIEVANYAALPIPGASGVIYITLDTNKVYRWSGSVYVEIASGVTNLSYTPGVSNGTVNSDTGTDATIPLAGTVNAGLFSAAEKSKLEGIAPNANVGVIPNAPITGATKTKITYDTKGLVTAGADATTADIADSTNKRYVTDANLTVINNTSGTNTGDQNLQQVTDIGASTTNGITITVGDGGGDGIHSSSSQGYGIRGESSENIAVYATAISSTGVYAEGNVGVHAYSAGGTGIEVYGNGTVGISVNLGNSNKGLVIYSGASSIGNPIEIVKSDDVKFTINQQGEQSIVKIPGGTGTNVLLDNGTTAAVSSLGSQNLQQVTNLGATTTNSITANSFIKNGGTSAQLLAADGSVITAGTNITISGGQISSTGGGGDFVPYTGATSDVNLGEFGIQLGNLEFDNTPTNIPTTAGSMYYNDADGTLDLILKGGNVKLQIGQETVIRVVNKTATNISLLESNYQAVRITGAQGQRPKVDLAQATNDELSAETIGLVTETIDNNQEGFITTSGLVRNINTTGSLQGETWLDGDILYLSSTIAGNITKVKPVAPNHLIIIGYVIHAHITQGTIFVKVDNGYELNELHNVKINGVANNNVLAYTSSTSIWENKTIETALGYTPVNKAGDTMTGSLILNANPTVAFGAATKSYVDTLINGIDWKAAANAATTTSLPTYTVSGSGQILTGTVTIPVIDGVTLTATQRLLVKNETSTLAPNNGIYVVTQVNPFILTRSSDANTPALLAEATISVSGGSTLSNTQWHCNPAAVPIVIGTTNIAFAGIGANAYTFSSPLINTSNVISVLGASATQSGVVTTGDQTFSGAKTFAIGIISPQYSYTGGSIFPYNNDTFYVNQSSRTHYFGMGNGFGPATLSNNVSVPNGTFNILLQTASTIASFDANKNVVSLTTADGYPTLTELKSLVGVSATTIQTQLNAKVTSVTGTAPVVSSGGTTPAISMAAATGSVDGYLTAANWTTFNNKVSAQTGQIILTSGTSTILPATITTSTIFRIELIGGGGGGAGGSSTNQHGSGGGAGGYVYKELTGFTGGGTLNYTIGAAGNGGASASNGTAGTSTTLTAFSVVYTASGGGAGLAAVSSAGGVGGVGTNGDINMTGQAGDGTPSGQSLATASARGGDSPKGWGSGGSSVIQSRNGNAGTGYGSGGSSGKLSTFTGGAGAQGIIVITWFN